VTVDAYLVGQATAIVVAAGAAFFDARRGEIPNPLTLGALAVAVIGYGAFGGLIAAGLSLGGAAAAALLPFLLYRAGAMGGGDVKAFAAIGALLGLAPGLEAELLAFLFAMIWHGARLTRAGALARTLKRSSLLLWRRPEGAEATPFEEVRLGPALLAGTACAVAAIHL